MFNLNQLILPSCIQRHSLQKDLNKRVNKNNNITDETEHVVSLKNLNI